MAFPPKAPGAGAPPSLRDLRRGVAKTPGSPSGKGTPATCPSCGEALELNVSKSAGPGGMGDNDGDEGGDGGGGSDSIVSGGGY